MSAWITQQETLQLLLRSPCRGENSTVSLSAEAGAIFSARSCHPVLNARWIIGQSVQLFNVNCCSASVCTPQQPSHSHSRGGGMARQQRRDHHDHQLLRIRHHSSSSNLALLATMTVTGTCNRARARQDRIRARCSVRDIHTRQHLREIV